MRNTVLASFLSFCRSLSFKLTAFVLISAIGSIAEQRFTQSNDDLGKIITDGAKNVLGTCQSWPPKLAKNSKDQTKAPDSKDLKDGTDVIAAQLTRTTFGLDPTVKPFQYDGSFLRLLDSLETSDPAVSDDKLFGLARLTDPNQLNLWGTNLVVVRYDCLSMLSLMVQANSSFSIPLFSLNAAFQANSSVSANQNSTFMIGLFQSPFDFLYNAPEQPQVRVYAAMKAVDWRVRNNNRGQAQYVSAGHFLTITKTTANSQTLAILGNFRGGVQIPFVQLGSGVAGQLSNSLQTDARGYSTYFWGVTQQNLPDLAALSSRIANSLPPFVTDRNTVTVGATLTATQTILGWPAELCNANRWSASVQNANFTPGPLQFTAAPAVAGLSTCSIAIQFSLHAGRGDVTDPKLALQYRENEQIDPQILLPLHLSGALHLEGKPAATVITTQAGWTDVRDSFTQQKTFVQWSFPVHVDVHGRKIQAITVNRGKFDCRTQDSVQSSLEITDAQIAGNPPVVMRSGDNPDFTINALLTLQGAHQYNDDVTQPNRKNCLIYGSVDITSTDSQNAHQQVDTVEFHTATMLYPNDLPTAPPPTPTNVAATSGNTQVLLSWASSNGATSYNIYRATPPASETQLKNGLTKPSHQDTSLTNGTAYSYSVTAVNAAGESGRSESVNVTPMAPPLAPINVAASKVGDGSITLSWSASIGASSYNVYRSTLAGAETAKIGNTSLTSFSDTGLTNGATYFYVVTAANSAGEGNKSGEISATPKQ